MLYNIQEIKGNYVEGFKGGIDTLQQSFLYKDFNGKSEYSFELIHKNKYTLVATIYKNRRPIHSLKIDIGYKGNVDDEDLTYASVSFINGFNMFIEFPKYKNQVRIENFKEFIQDEVRYYQLVDAILKIMKNNAKKQEKEELNLLSELFLELSLFVKQQHENEEILSLEEIIYFDKEYYFVVKNNERLSIIVLHHIISNGFIEGRMYEVVKVDNKELEDENQNTLSFLTDYYLKNRVSINKDSLLKLLSFY